ncbi:hypothetical protein KR084_010832 [Drosophila pseudotakahashii]|nr:hypothetical protein KR084_010832 [Drosophila pseudotakahashii]
MTLHQSRSMLAECIKLIRSQNRQLLKNYTEELRNERRLRKLLRKFKSHRSHSQFLRKSLNNLKRSIYEHAWTQSPINTNDGPLQTKLKCLGMLAKRNFTEAEECVKVTKDIMTNHARRKNRSKIRIPKSSFEIAIWEFFNAVEIYNMRVTNKDNNEIKGVPRLKGPYKVPEKRDLGFIFPKTEDTFNERSKELNHKKRNKDTINSLIEGYQNSKVFERKRKNQSTINELNHKNNKDSIDSSIEGKEDFTVLHTRSTDELPASKVQIRVYPRNRNSTNDIKNKTIPKELNPSIPEPKDLKNKIKKKNRRIQKLKKGIKSKALLKNKLPKIKLWLGSHKRAHRKDPSPKEESLGKDQSKQRVRSSHTQRESTKDISKTTKSNTQSGTYEKLKSAYRSYSQNSKRQSSVIKRKAGTKENFSKMELESENKSTNQLIPSRYFEITSKYNPSIGESTIFNRNTLPLVKKKISTLFGATSAKALDGVGGLSTKPLLPMSSTATEIINRLYEQKTISPDESKRFHKKIDTTRLHSNSPLNLLPKYRHRDQVSAVLGDLLGKHKEYSEIAKTPEDAHKLKKILKWRYIHNVQKVLHNQVRKLKADIEIDGRSETESRRSQISYRSIRASYQVPNRYLKRSSNIDTSPIKPIHDIFIRSQMDWLRSRLFDKDVERMEHMIMGRHVPINEDDLEIFRKYKYDPQHYNILILSIGKHISDEKYEETLPVLERNFQYINHQLEVLSREKRIQIMQAKNKMQRAEEEVASKHSGDSCHYERIDFNEAFLEKRREVWAAFIAKQAKSPTEILLEANRKQKRKALIAKKKEEREERRKQEQQIPKHRRSLSALYRAPRRTHREQQAIKDIQEELEGRKSKCSVTSLCCRQCSRCGLIWTQRCSEDSTDGTAEHICPVYK